MPSFCLFIAKQHFSGFMFLSGPLLVRSIMILSPIVSECACARLDIGNVSYRYLPYLSESKDRTMVPFRRFHDFSLSMHRSEIKDLPLLAFYYLLVDFDASELCVKN